jgi:CheY-like chemotaxis protein
MKKILIIDDEADFAYFLKKSLNLTKEFEAEAFTDTKNVLERVKSYKPDLILLDLLMPEIGGMEVCEMLNDDNDTKMIPIVIISAIGSFTDVKRAYLLGVIGYLTKPFDFEQLLTEVRKVLSYKDKP